MIYISMLSLCWKEDHCGVDIADTGFRTVSELTPEEVLEISVRGGFGRNRLSSEGFQFPPVTCCHPSVFLY